MSNKLGMKKKKALWAAANPEKMKMINDYNEELKKSWAEALNTVIASSNTVMDILPAQYAPKAPTINKEEVNNKVNAILEANPEAVAVICKEDGEPTGPVFLESEIITKSKDGEYHRTVYERNGEEVAVKYSEVLEEEIEPFNSNLNCEPELKAIEFKSYIGNNEVHIGTAHYDNNGKLAVFNTPEEAPTLKEEAAPKGLLGKIKQLFKGKE